jgi:hypothetical protein
MIAQWISQRAASNTSGSAIRSQTEALQMTPKTFPRSTEEMRNLHPELDRLEPDSPKGAPCGLSEIGSYLRAEGFPRSHDLLFGRTARIGKIKFWLWGYSEGDETYYVDVSSDGNTHVIAAGSADNLTPEQYLALSYVRGWRDIGRSALE